MEEIRKEERSSQNFFTIPGVRRASDHRNQVEQLKGNLSGFWSRRIDKHYRIIYAIHEEIVTVEVVSVKSHYGDK